jgi:DNA polymerase III subunit epsilon
VLSALDWRRRWQLRRTLPCPLRDYLARPLPPKGQDYRTTDFVAIDLETTGLDASRDLILSVGYVVLHGNRIDLSSTCHRVVRIDRSIPEASAVIHQITDDQSARGLELVDVMAELLDVLAGKVLVAHHASIECGFLGNACRRLWGSGLPVQVVDTQVLAHRTFERRQTAFKASDLRLHSLGERFNLPRYGAHNALSDALAAAELFLAQAAYRDNGQGLPLKEFLW